MFRQICQQQKPQNNKCQKNQGTMPAMSDWLPFWYSVFIAEHTVPSRFSDGHTNTQQSTTSYNNLAHKLSLRSRLLLPHVRSRMVHLRLLQLPPPPIQQQGRSTRIRHIARLLQGSVRRPNVRNVPRLPSQSTHDRPLGQRRRQVDSESWYGLPVCDVPAGWPSHYSWFSYGVRYVVGVLQGGVQRSTFRSVSCCTSQSTHPESHGHYRGWSYGWSYGMVCWS